jgi:hypothetical protein
VQRLTSSSVIAMGGAAKQTLMKLPHFARYDNCIIEIQYIFYIIGYFNIKN